jgi:hypothetical protein
MAKPVQTWEGEGAIDFHAFVCSMLRTDLGGGDLVEPELNQYFQDSLKITAQVDARNFMDSVTLLPFPRGLSAATCARLFHERVHYWQLLSSPFLQTHYTRFMELLGVRIGERGGVGPLVFGWMPGLSRRAQDLSFLESEFGWIDMERERIVGTDSIAADPDTRQIYFLQQTSKGLVPRYGAAISARGRHVLVPFTVQTLTESAALISERLYAAEELPSGPDEEPDWNPRYMGCWEYWKRLHRTRYASTEELALSFLAAVDLALAATPLMMGLEPGMDQESAAEAFNLSYRFGKLAFRSQGFPPLEYAADAALAIDQFQRKFCQYCGWEPPDTAVRVVAVYLTQLLSAALGWPTARAETQPDSALVRWLFTAHPREVMDRLDELKPVWDYLSELEPESKNPVIGHRVAGMMLNACWHRLKHPGRQAAPHIAADILPGIFPLPFILIDGRYHYDLELEDPKATFGDERPFKINALAISAECVMLGALSPLAAGTDRCGFLDPITKRARCFYGLGGLGCPHPTATLSESEREQRERLGVDDWCHWTFATLNTEIAAPEIARRWQQRRRRAGPA